MMMDNLGNDNTEESNYSEYENVSLLSMKIMAPNEHGLCVLSRPKLEYLLKPENSLPIKIISIFGNRTTGKSFLMNLLINYLENNCTGLNGTLDLEGGFKCCNFKGSLYSVVRIYPKIFEAQISNGDKVGILLMDIQGLFDSDQFKRTNPLLFNVCKILSSKLICNVKEQSIPMSTLNSIIQISGQTKMFRNTDLVFLLRDQNDINLDLPISNYIKEKPEAKLNKLHELFNDVSYAKMPKPGNAVLKRRFKGNISELSPKFVTQLNSFFCDLTNFADSSDCLTGTQLLKVFSSMTVKNYINWDKFKAAYQKTNCVAPILKAPTSAYGVSNNESSSLMSDTVDNNSDPVDVDQAAYDHYRLMKERTKIELLVACQSYNFDYTYCFTSASNLKKLDAICFKILDKSFVLSSNWNYPTVYQNIKDSLVQEIASETIKYAVQVATKEYENEMKNVQQFTPSEVSRNNQEVLASIRLAFSNTLWKNHQTLLNNSLEEAYFSVLKDCCLRNLSRTIRWKTQCSDLYSLDTQIFDEYFPSISWSNPNNKVQKAELQRELNIKVTDRAKEILKEKYKEVFKAEVEDSLLPSFQETIDTLHFKTTADLVSQMRKISPKHVDTFSQELNVLKRKYEKLNETKQDNTMKGLGVAAAGLAGMGAIYMASRPKKDTKAVAEGNSNRRQNNNDDGLTVTDIVSGVTAVAGLFSAFKSLTSSNTNSNR